MAKIWMCYWSFASLTLISCADWVELPKLQPEDFRNRVNKWAVVEGKLPVKSTVSTPLTIDTVEGTLGEDENVYNYSNTTLFEPNIESLFFNVHRALVDKTKKSLPQKVDYLRRLENNILDMIWRRSQNLWALEKGRGDVSEFPSLEGALMTISVLTFAVFLIKIVSQFIQGLQGTNATTMTVTTPVTTGTRLKREIEMPLSDVDVIKMIEEFQSMHGN